MEDTGSTVSLTVQFSFSCIKLLNNLINNLILEKIPFSSGIEDHWVTGSWVNGV